MTTLSTDVAKSIVDLFSGVGGLSLGAARAGFEVRAAVDIDPKARCAHQVNFPNASHLNTDIAHLTGKTLKQALNLQGEELAGIIGGPPCQGFSEIGRRHKHDSRNAYFVEFFRLVSETLPQFFLVENVPGIMHDTYSSIRSHAFAYVAPSYSILEPMILSASDYGAATSRTRVFFFGYLADAIDTLTVASFRPPSDIEKVRVTHALYGLPTKVDPGWQTEELSWRVVRSYRTGLFAHRLRAHIPRRVGDKSALQRMSDRSEVSGFLGTAHTEPVVRRFRDVECGKYDRISKSYRLDPAGFCPTLRAGTGPQRGSYQAVRPIHPTEHRVITPREAARLQGFPDWFQFSPTKWHSFRQIGNSVSPILAECILTVVAASLGISNAMEDESE